jgi:hypothetical protein
VDWLHFYTLGHNGALPDDYFPTDLRMAQVTFAGSQATGSFTYLVRQYTGGSRPPSFEERRWEVRVDFEARRIE